MLSTVLTKLEIPDYGHLLDRLINISLINYFGGNYAISGPVRLVFRQMYGLGDDGVISAVRDILEDALPTEGTYRADTVDSVTFLYNISGKALPRTLQEIVSPSSMLEAARELYREGREKPGDNEYKRCVSLCDAALQVTDEPALRAEILTVQARTYSRLKRFDLADTAIKILERTADRQALVIRAQYYRFKGEFANAAPIYSAVIDSGLNDDAVIHEYCICLREVGSFEKVQDVIKQFSRRVVKNIYLLDMRSSLEIGAGRFRDAEATLKIMRTLPDKNEAAARKEAIMICKETQNYSKAYQIVSDAILAIEGNRLSSGDLYATRCVILAKMGRADEARDDLAIARSTHRQSDFIAARLSIHILMAEKKNMEALQAFDSLPVKTRLDRSLRREILKCLSDDQSILESTRRKYSLEYREAAAERASFTEFDF